MEIILWKMIQTCSVFIIISIGVMKAFDFDELHSFVSSSTVVSLFISIAMLVVSVLILIWI